MALNLTNSDIVSALPILADIHEKADSGTTSTLNALTLQTLNDEEVVGSTLCILNGSLKGSDITVTGYTDGVLSFDAQASAITNTTIFGLVYKDYASYIERAEVIISNQFRNKSKDLSKFLTTSQLKELHLLKTLELICLAKRKDASSEDIYHINYMDFRESYSNELLTLRADYDADDSGEISEDEEKISNQVRLRK